MEAFYLKKFFRTISCISALRDDFPSISSFFFGGKKSRIFSHLIYKRLFEEEPRRRIFLYFFALFFDFLHILLFALFFHFLRFLISRSLLFNFIEKGIFLYILLQKHPKKRDGIYFVLFIVENDKIIIK